MALVDQYDRNEARRNAFNLTMHSLHRVFDAINEASAAENDEPDKLISACAKVSALAGKAQQMAHVYKGFFLAWKENEPKPATPLPEVAQVPQAAPIVEAPSDIF
ncbi:MAG: hypothetical protein NVS9B14_06440 [Candidatus Acidiferrum sp.]